MTLQLFTTAGCHLCEQALALLDEAGAVNVRQVEIGDDAGLIDRYGVRIPVLRFPDGAELDWPFSVADITGKRENHA